MKLLSVIIPVYNAEKYLENCWNSLRQQTYPVCEFLFVDDCSTDGSLEILKEFEKKDKRIRILSTGTNQGVSAARNVGLRYASGCYIGFCDADDYVDKDMYVNMISCLEQHNADIVTSGVIRESEDGMTKSGLFNSDSVIVFNSEDALKSWMIGEKISNSVCTKVFKADVFVGICFPEGEIFEEAFVIPQLLLRTARIVHAGISPYHYIVRANSLTTREFSERKMTVYPREEYIKELVVSKYPALQSAYISFCVRNNLSVCYSAIRSSLPRSSEIYRRTKKEVRRYLWPGLTNPYLSIKTKFHLCDVIFGTAYLRFRVFRRKG